MFNSCIFSFCFNEFSFFFVLQFKALSDIFQNEWNENVMSKLQWKDRLNYNDYIKSTKKVFSHIIMSLIKQT